jgi:hypothetical protein
VAVATAVESPSAVIDGALNATITPAAAPRVCIRDAEPDRAGETELSVAVIVNVPVAGVDVIVAWYVPGAEPAVTGLIR